MCGVDVMSLVVRNDPTFHFDPIWFFTDEKIRTFLRNNVQRGFNEDRIAAMVEGFVIADCDMKGELSRPVASYV